MKSFNSPYCWSLCMMMCFRLNKCVYFYQSSVCVPSKCEQRMRWSNGGDVAHSRIPDFKLDHWRWSKNTHTQKNSSVPVIYMYSNRFNVEYLLSMMSTTEPSGLMKAEYSRSVALLWDTPTLWDPSSRNLLCKMVICVDLVTNASLQCEYQSCKTHNKQSSTWSGPCCRRLAACRRRHAWHQQ